MEELKDFIVPLEHATLTRDEVASRCVAAAERKGYKSDTNERFCELQNCDSYFDAKGLENCGYGFYAALAEGEVPTTLEAFEEYCGVGQPPMKERAFEDFYVQCTRDEYPEVKRILEAQGYRLHGDEWMEGEDCVATTNDGWYSPIFMSFSNNNEPTYTLDQLREKFGVAHQESPSVDSPCLWGNFQEAVISGVKQTSDENDYKKLKYPNKFGTLDRFTYIDGTPYEYRKLAEGEVIRVVDHMTGEISPQYGGWDKDLEERPPIGLKPKWLWEQERCGDIFDAMERYSESKLAIPVEWVEELRESVFKLQDNQ